MPLDGGFVPTNTRYPFLEILKDSCCWPNGEPGAPDFHFCGAPAADGSAYCHIHKARAYIPKSEHAAALAALKREAGLELRRIAHEEERKNLEQKVTG